MAGRWAIAYFLLAFSAAHGCIWDRDTIASEVEGRREVGEVIVGWFDRNPDRYYEMRLERVLGELEAKPEALPLYDDAAVALDRLHRSDEAIEMMARKWEVLEGMEDSEERAEQEYRYLANLGTFYVHRWIGLGEEARNQDLSDLKEGERLIAEAIALNPEAHFGREEYQLKAIQWLLAEPDVYPYGEAGSLYWGPEKAIVWPLSEVENSELQDPNRSRAVEGLSGLITLGAAWQSVDVYVWLRTALGNEGRSSLSFLAHQRVNELEGEGAKTIHPSGVECSLGFERLKQNPEALERWYKVARRQAEERHEARTVYMNVRFDTGEHPDTDVSFWDGWEEPVMLPYPRDALNGTSRFVVVVGWLLFFLALFIWFLWWIKRKLLWAR